MKIDWSIVILLTVIVGAIVAGIGAYAAYRQGKEDGLQINRIDTNSSLGITLSKEIRQLQTVSADLTEQTKNVVVETQKLTLVTNEILSKLKSSTDNEFAQSAISGKLDLEITSGNSDSITFSFGPQSYTVSVKELAEREHGFMQIGDFRPIRFQLVNNRLLLNLEVYDLKGDLIAEIDNSNWRRNPNASSKFNYDKKGFEILDNQNRVALNVNILRGNKVQIQGVLPVFKYNAIFFGGTVQVQGMMGSSLVLVPKNTSYDMLLELYLKHYEVCKIRKIFDYSGENWLGKRAQH